MGAKCNLIIDSCCDLPFEVIDREGIELLEFPYSFEAPAKGKDAEASEKVDPDAVELDEHLDDLYRTATPHEFFERMRKGAQSKTAQIAIPVLRDSFERALSSGVPTVFFCLSSGLSGTFDTACVVAEELRGEHPDGELFVVDTKLASLAEGLLVYEAIRQRDKGLTAHELVAWAEEARFFVNAEFMVDDLEALRRGGRIPASVAFAGAKLDVKPLLGFDVEGKLTLTSIARGRKKGIRQLVDFLLKRVPERAPGSFVIVGNADCPKDANRMKEMLAKADESLLFLEGNVGPVIGSHTGPEMLCLVFWGPDRRKDVSMADKIAAKVKGGN